MGDGGGGSSDGEISDFLSGLVAELAQSWGCTVSWGCDRRHSSWVRWRINPCLLLFAGMVYVLTIYHCLLEYIIHI